MNITIFTSNKLRHNNLISELSYVCDNLYCIQECKEALIGRFSGSDEKSDIMSTYIQNVAHAEKSIFSKMRPSSGNISLKKIKMGELSLLKEKSLSKFLQSDIYIVFGSSYIKGWLIDYLVSKNAVNIHMGLSPYYRGSGCNFWALHDDQPQYVGSTIHRLSHGLDSGKIIAHALPAFDGEDVFEFTMKSVMAAQKLILKYVEDKKICYLESFNQEKSHEVRYSKYSDFTIDVIKRFNSMNINLHKKFNSKSLIYPELIRPLFYE